MTFVGQFPIPAAEVRLAYLFVVDDDEGRGGSMMPDYSPDLLEGRFYWDCV